MDTQAAPLTSLQIACQYIPYMKEVKRIASEDTSLHPELLREIFADIAQDASDAASLSESDYENHTEQEWKELKAQSLEAADIIVKLRDIIDPARFQMSIDVLSHIYSNFQRAANSIPYQVEIETE